MVIRTCSVSFMEGFIEPTELPAPILPGIFNRHIEDLNSGNALQKP